MYLADERDVFQLMGVLTQLIQGLTQSLKTSQLRDSVGFCTNLSPLISVVGCQRLATSYHGSIRIEIEVIGRLGKNPVVHDGFLGTNAVKKYALRIVLASQPALSYNFSISN
jgi:hypothetical protein